MVDDIVSYTSGKWWEKRNKQVKVMTKKLQESESADKKGRQFDDKLWQTVTEMR